MKKKIHHTPYIIRPKLLNRSLSLTIVFVLVSGIVFAQKSREQLEREKRENLEKITEVRGILTQTTAQKRASLGQLKAVNREIETQSKKIDLINDDIQLMNRELTELESAKNELDSDLAKLKAEYAAMIYTSSKRNNTLNSLSFLFSAASFNQFWVRYKYLRQYSDERQKQVTQMKKVQQLMADKTYRITGKKTDQQKALTSKIDETKNLEVLKTKKSSVVTELSQREKELKNEMAEIRKENQRIESTLTNIIRREIQERRNREARDKAIRQRVEQERLARERAEAKKTDAERAEDRKDEPVIAKVEPKPETVPNSDGMNEAEVAIASSFSASKGRMLWPVRSGFVSSHFGTKINAELGLPQPNDGVDIQTKTGEVVHSVYDGIVVEVSFEALSKNVVYIQHGNYYTVYTKLKNVSVRKGQKVKARDAIGTVVTDSDGTSEINFQVWKDFDKLNPEKWLSPR